MRRREFIAGLGGAAAWPLMARAQQRTPVVGVLNAGVPLAHAFQQGLGEQGYIDGQNVEVLFRNTYDRLTALAEELVFDRFAWWSGAGHVRPQAIDYIRDGKLRALAVTTATRSEILPNVPVLSDFVPGSRPEAGGGYPRRRTHPTKLSTSSVTQQSQFSQTLESRLGSPSWELRRYSTVPVHSRAL
jgi:hypothetical protein